jgi:hypothetical protein
MPPKTRLMHLESPRLKGISFHGNLAAKMAPVDPGKKNACRNQRYANKIRPTAPAPATTGTKLMGAAPAG